MPCVYLPGPAPAVTVANNYVHPPHKPTVRHSGPHETFTSILNLSSTSCFFSLFLCPLSLSPLAFSLFPYLSSFYSFSFRSLAILFAYFNYHFLYHTNQCLQHILYGHGWRIPIFSVFSTTPYSYCSSFRVPSSQTLTLTFALLPSATCTCGHRYLIVLQPERRKT